MDAKLQQLIDVSVRNGVLDERVRILNLLIKYKEAGWLDDDLITLLTEDICEGEVNGSV